MKKSLIAVAVAGLFAAPVAMAEVTLSGAINLGIEIAKSGSAPANNFFGGGNPAVNSVTRTLLNANYSHVDLDSVDDIGGGNKIIFHYQLVAQPQQASGSANDFNRNSYLGVMGSWGAFKMGTNENVYERFMYQADPLEGAVGPGGNLMILGTPGAGTAFDQGQAACGVNGPGFGCIGFYRRTDQTIWYESPNFSGFSFEVDYTLSAFKTAPQAPAAADDPTVLSIGGKWQPEGAPFYVDVAYEKHDGLFALNAINGPGTATSSDDDAIQVGGGFTFGDWGLGARYEQLSYSTNATATGHMTKLERDAFWFAVKWTLPTGYVGAELGIADSWETSCVGGNAANTGCPGTDTGAKMFGIGYFHNLSKQSQLQFIYGRTDNETNASYTQAGAANGGQLGADHQVFHAGIKHTF